jgi:hypothetical protein
MPDPAAQLATLHSAGFEIQTFERYPRSIGVMRGNIVALVEPTTAGLRMLGTPGWRMGNGAGVVMGVLVEENGRQVFRAKESVIPATPEHLAELKAFREELQRFLEESA